MRCYVTSSITIVENLLKKFFYFTKVRICQYRNTFALKPLILLTNKGIGKVLAMYVTYARMLIFKNKNSKFSPIYKGFLNE